MSTHLKTIGQHQLKARGFRGLLLFSCSDLETYFFGKVLLNIGMELVLFCFKDKCPETVAALRLPPS
jgi:hypothetical protein